jgi:1-acyl-sn-glycerol-3-phosphate acyltransferase
MSLFGSLKFPTGISAADDALINEAFGQLRARYKNYQDPWGFSLETCEQALRRLIPLYRYYFKVRLFGKENLTDEAYIVVSNHSGQLPLDGMLMNMAFVLELDNPRILRGMVERFMVQLPFLADLSAQTGSILGDRANCQYLLDHGESILVFPEGVRGTSKSTVDYYRVQPFTQGFYRIALQKHTRILPAAVVGAEEMFPFVWQARAVAKALGMPALPLSANYWPLPSPVDIHLGKPLDVPIDLSPDAPEKDIKEQVLKVEGQVKRLLAVGLKHRRPFFDPIRKPLSKLILKQEREP